MMNANILVIVWRISEYCNLGCRFCEYSRYIRRPRVTADPDQVIAFGALLGKYSAEYKREVLVSWLGGEPLIWPPFMDIARLFKRQFNVQIGVTTNGTLLDSAAMRQRITEDFDQITISVDGIGAFHDGCRDAVGLYDQLRASIISLRALKNKMGHGPLIRVNSILMRTNIHAFEQLCYALAEWGVEELTFNALGGDARDEFFQRNRLLPEHIEWLRQELPHVREQMSRLGLKVCGSQTYLERIASSAQAISIPVVDCQPGLSFLFVDERGFIGPCSFTARDYGCALEEMKHPRDLHQLPLRLAARRRKELLAPCFDCLSTHVFRKFAAE